MKCLIIAAGQGSRIRDKGASKPLVPLLHKPLIEWVVTGAAAAGVNEFLVVTGYNREPLEAFLGELSCRLNCPIHPIYNPDWMLANGLSVLKARDAIKGPFLLTMADHVVAAEIPRKLMTANNPGSALTLGVDRRLDNPLVDLDDVTKVATQGDRIITIGKDLATYDCFDTGVFLATPALFDALDEHITATGESSLSGGVRRLAARGKARALDVSGHFWIDVDDPAAYDRAAACLQGTAGPC